MARTAMRRRDFLKCGAALAVPAAAGRENLPDWAQPGHYVMMGLDGGPLEAEKGLRSGWEHFTRDDPNGVVQAVRDFYRPENIEIPVTAGANWVYVTWSNGWSKQRERAEQWPPAERFMRECRKRGIHAGAYISATNIFWEDYFERTPESRQWVDTVQPNLVRHYGSSMFRVMANLRSQQWRNEIKTAVDAAIDAGAGSFWIDNMFWWHGSDLFADVMRDLERHAVRRKSGIIWHANVNRGIYSWARAGDVVGTEDGRAPCFNPSSDPSIAGNQGLLSLIAGLDEGWRPAELEHYGNNLPARVRQLMIAECWMWQVASVWFPADRLLQARWHRREPESWKVLEAIGAYNRHQLKHTELFTRGEPLAAVGVVGHPGVVGKDFETEQRTMREQGNFITLLDRMAARKVQYEVLFEDRLQPERLRNFALIAWPYPERSPKGAAAALEAYAAAGGILLRRPGSDLAAEISKLGRHDLIEAQVPASVCYRAIRQGQRLVVHFVNYSDQPAQPFIVRYRGTLRSAQALVPEDGLLRSISVHRDGAWSTIKTPEFPIHALLALTIS